MAVGLWRGDFVSWGFSRGMNRVVQAELLDELEASDPRAIHSRRDLRRINALMGNARILKRFVGQEARRLGMKSPVTVVELGAGDGNIGAQIARHLGAQGISGRLMLVDQQRIAAPVILAKLDSSWNVMMIRADVMDWIAQAPNVEIIVCNLFLHHFEDATLRTMLAEAARRCRCFVAAEPRRSGFAEWFARKVWMIGCNEVTCHDAEISVRAGFARTDLSGLWPNDGAWRLTERRAGMFSHFFGASRPA